MIWFTYAAIEPYIQSLLENPETIPTDPNSSEGIASIAGIESVVSFTQPLSLIRSHSQRFLLAFTDDVFHVVLFES